MGNLLVGGGQGKKWGRVLLATVPELDLGTLKRIPRFLLGDQGQSQPCQASSFSEKGQ